MRSTRRSPEISRNAKFKTNGTDMLKYIAETYITLSDSDVWLEQICQKAAELCPSIISDRQERRFKCEKEHATISPADIVAKRACTQIRYRSRSAVTEGTDKFLNFGDGCAIIRSTKDGLFFRISARDLVIFYGIRMLLEGSLLKLATVSNDAIEWFPAGREPPRLPSHIREH
jgi:hypothetical protein